MDSNAMLADIAIGKLVARDDPLWGKLYEQIYQTLCKGYNPPPSDATIADLRAENSRLNQAIMLMYGGIMPENAAWCGDVHRTAEVARATGDALNAEVVKLRSEVERLTKEATDGWAAYDRAQRENNSLYKALSDRNPPPGHLRDEKGVDHLVLSCGSRKNESITVILEAATHAAQSKEKP